MNFQKIIPQINPNHSSNQLPQYDSKLNNFQQQNKDFGQNDTNKSFTEQIHKQNFQKSSQIDYIQQNYFNDNQKIYKSVCNQQLIQQNYQSSNNQENTQKFNEQQQNDQQVKIQKIQNTVEKKKQSRLPYWRKQDKQIYLNSIKRALQQLPNPTSPRHFNLLLQKIIYSNSSQFIYTKKQFVKFNQVLIRKHKTYQKIVQNLQKEPYKQKKIKIQKKNQKKKQYLHTQRTIKDESLLSQGRKLAIQQRRMKIKVNTLKRIIFNIAKQYIDKHNQSQQIKNNNIKKIISTQHIQELSQQPSFSINSIFALKLEMKHHK